MFKSNVAVDDFNKPQRRKTQEHGFCSRHVSGLIKSFTEDSWTRKSYFCCKKLDMWRETVKGYFEVEMEWARIFLAWSCLWPGYSNDELTDPLIQLQPWSGHTKSLRPLVKNLWWAWLALHWAPSLELWAWPSLPRSFRHWVKFRLENKQAFFFLSASLFLSPGLRFRAQARSSSSSDTDLPQLIFFKKIRIFKTQRFDR